MFEMHKSCINIKNCGILLDYKNDYTLQNKEASMADNNTSTESNFKSNIKIADDVIGSIAALAAMDVDGVSAMAGNVTNEIFAKLGGKTLGKGVKAVVSGDDVKFDLAIIVDYGGHIPDVCKRVQDKVRTTVENMTGFGVSEINVTIAGVNVPENA